MLVRLPWQRERGRGRYALTGDSPSACSRRLGSTHGDRRRPRGRFHARSRSRAASRAEIYPANRSIIRYLMVFLSVCVCAGETCGGDDAAAICIVNVVGQQQEHQQQRNGAVSISRSRTQLHHCADLWSTPCIQWDLTPPTTIDTRSECDVLWPRCRA